MIIKLKRIKLNRYFIWEFWNLLRVNILTVVRINKGFNISYDEQTKKLMQDSALVIIDYNDAIDNGFVELTNDLKDLFNEEYNWFCCIYYGAW